MQTKNQFMVITKTILQIFLWLKILIASEKYGLFESVNFWVCVVTFIWKLKPSSHSNFVSSLLKNKDGFNGSAMSYQALQFEEPVNFVYFITYTMLIERIVIVKKMSMRFQQKCRLQVPRAQKRGLIHIVCKYIISLDPGLA